MKYIIILIFSFIVIVAASCHTEKEKPAETKPAVTPQYTFAVVEKAGVSTVIKLPAQIAAFEEVSIFPKVNGYVKNVLVDIGSKVTRESLLMTLEAPELEQASLQARERYTRAKADLSLDKEHYQRLQEASKTAGAISPLDISTAKTKMDADSSLSNAEKANWQMQQSMLDYLQVRAPFDGVITERNVHPGALVSAAVKDKPMLELKQVKHLRLQVDIPEAMAASIKNRDTVSFYTSAFPGKRITGNISRRAMNINSQLRSERMEIDVLNADGSLSPGMFAEVVFQSSGNKEGLAVPRSAVVTSTERKYVLVMRDGKIRKIDVSTGNESTSKIEVYGMLQAGDKVIVNANDEMKESN